MIQEPKQETTAATVWTKERLDLLKSTVAVGLTDNEFRLFVEICKSRQLNPFNKQVYAVKRDGRLVIQTSIDGYRLIAERSGKYLGQTSPEWCGQDGVWTDIWTKAENPFACRIGVFKAGHNVPTIGIAYWSAYVAPGPFWKKAGPHMLSKCLPGDTRIRTRDGTLFLKDIVKGKKKVSVHSVSVSKNEQCYAPVVNWWKNSPTKDWIRVWSPSGSRGNRHVRLTPEHPVFTSTGWKAAGKLAQGTLVAVDSAVLSDEARQVVLGSILGDGTLAGRKVLSTQPHLAISHSSKQEGYITWKFSALNCLSPVLTKTRNNDGTGKLHDVINLRTKSSASLYRYRLTPPAWLLSELTLLGLAIWFMDDGSFKKTGPTSKSFSSAIYCCGFGPEFAYAAVAWFKSIGLTGKVLRPQKNPYLAFGVEDTKKLEKLLSPWLVREGTTKVWKAEKYRSPNKRGYAFVPVLKTEVVKSLKSETRYDLEVEGTHTFIVNGLVVSNCSEALALKKAFPEELSGLYTNDELEQSDTTIVPNVNQPTVSEDIQPLMIFPTEIIAKNHSGTLVRDAKGLEWIFAEQQFNTPVSEAVDKGSFLLVYYTIETGRRVVTGLGVL